jgi:FKBP-type peptidyl-prolyl cis-trans isomerase SlyD
MQIAPMKVVAMHYHLKDDRGETIDSSEGRDPMHFMCGTGGIIPGLESALMGRVAGDRLSVVVQPADGYGDYDPELRQAVPRQMFEDDGEIAPGMRFQTQDHHGHVTVVMVVAVDDEHIHIDANHPLAGEALHFDVEVVEVREATAEEVAHGHVHGPGGHHH